MTELTETGENFSNFFMLYLDESGRFLDPKNAQDNGESRAIPAEELPIFLKRTITLPEKVTDVFVWVHGWQNDELRALESAKRLFANLTLWLTREKARYPKLGDAFRLSSPCTGRPRRCRRPAATQRYAIAPRP